jgi:hypothetical protein
MRKVTLRIPVSVLALCLAAAQLPAQQLGSGGFQWYVGGQGGVMLFETPNQTSDGVVTGGGHLLIMARRTGLLFSVEEGFGSKEVTSYTDGNGSVQTVTFNDLRKYSAMLMAFPLQIPIQPYVGVGLGLLHIVNPRPSDTGSTETASALGSTGFASVLGGVQLKVARFIAFGQYQITSGMTTQRFRESSIGRDATGKMLNGPTHTFSAGLRIGLGNARERPQAGGY